jgi:hypothetical protein
LGSRRATERAGFRESLQAAVRRKRLRCFGGKGRVGEGDGRGMKRRFENKSLKFQDLPRQQERNNDKKRKGGGKNDDSLRRN